MDTPCHPPREVATGQQSRAGRPNGEPERARSRSWPAMSDSPAAKWSGNGSSSSKRRSTPFREGLLAGSDPAAAGRMGLSGSILPGANRGLAEMGVTPSHVQGARTGVGAPLAVVQTQAHQRHGRPGPCPAERRFRVRRPSK